MTIPGRELVGQSAQMRDNTYSDDYLRALNEFATVDEIFGEHRKDIAEGGNSVGRLTMGALGIGEWENHLVDIVMRAAKAGEWTAVIRRPGTQTEGLSAVRKKHYGYITEFDGKIFLMPTAMYLAYCKEELSSGK